MRHETSSTIPDRYMMTIDGLDEFEAKFLSEEAKALAWHYAPKLSGRSSRNITAIWGPEWFGLKWLDPYLFFQDAGIKPFTMKALAGKTIPMWVEDPTGEERRKNSKIKTRTTEDGRTQVLIFRKAAPMGSRKTVERNGVEVDVPRSYPGAPGRINMRQQRGEAGRVAGRIAKGNVGVRWRHPGLARRGFLREAMVVAATYHGYPANPVRDQWGRFR